MPIAQTSMATQSVTRDPVQAARVTALWFGVQLVWGAVLGISLQARCVQLAGTHALVAFGALAAGVTQLIVGPLSDRLRRAGRDRNVFYLIGALLAAACVVGVYLAPDVRVLFVAFIALQTAMNVIIAPYQAIVPDTLAPSRYGIGAGWLAAFAGAGNAAGAVLAAALGTVPALGYVLAAGLLAAVAVTLTYVHGITLRPLPPAAPIRASRTLVDLFVSRAFVYLGFYTMLDYLYFFVASVLPRNFALDTTRASGLCILIFTVLSVAGAALAARPADRVDERLVVTAGGSCIVIALVVLTLAAAPSWLPPAIAFAGIGWGIFLCADWAFACRLLPPAAMATTMAVWNLAVIGPQMLAPLAASALLSRLGTLASARGPRDALLLAGIEVLIGSAWIWRLPPGKLGDKA